MSSELKTLIGQLNPICRRSLELATGRCLRLNQQRVEIEHLLLELATLPAIDLPPILDAYGVDRGELASQAEQAIDIFARGRRRTPALAPRLCELLQDARVRSSVILESELIRSGALLLALIENRALRRSMLDSCPVLGHIPRDALASSVRELVRGSAEEGMSGASRSAAPGRAAGQSRTGRSLARRATGGEGRGAVDSSALDRFTVDLVAEARAGRIDPVRGRDREIRQLIDILSRRRQNNPLLVGEAGVGKTAIAEGLALRLAAGEVPAALAEVSLRALDLGRLQAGAGARGAFEQRMTATIEAVELAAGGVILFIDEAHTLVGAGGAAGSGDAANLLKPALARGGLPTIAATTWAEYKQSFEHDPALARRFQLVRVEEPDEESAVAMLRGLVPALEAHHRLQILDEACGEAVRLSRRFLTDRRLPAKAVDVLDTAAARVALAQSGTPVEIESIDGRLGQLELARRAGERDGDDDRSIDSFDRERAQLASERGKLEARWRLELAAASELQRIEARVARLGDADAGDRERAELALAEARERCQAVQGEQPLVPLAVDGRSVAAVISEWTGIAVGRILRDEIDGLLTLEQRLGRRIVGQDAALATLCRRLRTSRAGLDTAAGPRGVFLLVGDTGVGKTETAHAFASALFGDESSLVTLNMTEFQEAHSVATLKGAPPGYVGYGSGGLLTEAVRRKPYSVVLLDEFDRAHPNVVELFYQLFDRGTLDDGAGVTVDFSNTVVLLTSNLGAEILSETGSPPVAETLERLLQELRARLASRFSAALLGRLELVPFYPLGERELRQIVGMKLAAVQQRVHRHHLARLTFDEALIDVLAARCVAAANGAREIDRILNQSLLPELSTRILERLADGRGFKTVRITVDAAGEFI